ncbi:sterol desaturase family protein [Polyangium aurulentum]|uniref:sterol desaturase family protein n=1 Tax=Polyangium aurulentum TaxID=2567896 RepID=UPI00197DF62E|nr:sterol desaturase family protein [Polyangium aurulentum]UQA54916.1 sterol desaturase family protein [Polyangium aurulentum]
MVAAGASYWRVGPFILMVAAIVVMALERLLPHARIWQRDQGDTRTDAWHFAGNLAVNQASAALYAVVHAKTGGALGLWPSNWPFVVQFVLGALILDLGLYAIHRASHMVPFLWRLHAIHHSSRRLYWLNGQRRHLLHELLEGTPGFLALGVLGAPPNVVACYMAALTLHLMLQHGNIDYRAGVLRYVFAVAELHRWHHQRLYADVQGNYGALLSIWDYLLGTALPKRGDAPLDVGMDDEPDMPPDYVGQLRWPFARAPGARLACDAHTDKCDWPLNGE